MEAILTIAFALVGFAIAIVVGVFARRAALERMRRLQAFAGEIGFSFDPSNHGDWHSRWPHFECFQRGHSRRAYNLMSGPLPDGERGERCILGEYLFKETQGSGKNRRTVTYRFGFAIVITPWRDMPDVLVRKEHFLDKLAGFLGFDDIDFESAEFSRNFMVKSKDKRFAYDLIDPRMMEFLLSEPSPMVDIGDSSLCLWFGHDRTLEPEQFRSLLGWTRRFLQRWPRVVVARLNESSSSGVP